LKVVQVVIWGKFGFVFAPPSHSSAGAPSSVCPITEAGHTSFCVVMQTKPQWSRLSPLRHLKAVLVVVVVVVLRTDDDCVNDDWVNDIQHLRVP
jgi:hypothetical protein